MATSDSPPFLSENQVTPLKKYSSSGDYKQVYDGHFTYCQSRQNYLPPSLFKHHLPPSSFKHHSRVTSFLYMREDLLSKMFLHGLMQVKFETLSPLSDTTPFPTRNTHWASVLNCRV